MPWLAIVGNPGHKVHPLAYEARDRYRADMHAGHDEAAEYWRGQAGAFFTGNNPLGRLYYYPIIRGRELVGAMQADDGLDALRTAQEEFGPGVHLGVAYPSLKALIAREGHPPVGPIPAKRIGYYAKGGPLYGKNPFVRQARAAKKCAYCLAPTSGRDSVQCPDCGVNLHDECSEEIMGCPTPGCRRSAGTRVKERAVEEERAFSRRTESPFFRTTRREPVVCPTCRQVPWQGRGRKIHCRTCASPWSEANPAGEESELDVAEAQLALAERRARSSVAGSKSRGKLKSRSNGKKKARGNPHEKKKQRPKTTRYSLEEARKKFKGVDAAIKAYKRFHGNGNPPTHVTVYHLPDGNSKARVENVHTALHRTLETPYVVPWKSSKQGTLWLHEHPEGEGAPLEVLDPATGSTRKIAGDFVVDDWWQS